VARCDQCGRQIEFRWIGGRLVPLHLEGSCGAPASEQPKVTEPTCWATKCPKCEAEVFFIRHNGGSVWVEPPLGYPWYKHPCMHPDEAQGRARVPVLPQDPALATESQKGLLLAVVTGARWSGASTSLDLTAVGGDEWRAVVKNKADFLYGRLVLVSPSKRYVAPLERRDLPFKLLSLMKVE
jgi:hypothetical protein